MHTPFISLHKSFAASSVDYVSKFYLYSSPSPFITQRFTIYLNYLAILLPFIAYLFEFPSHSTLSFYFTFLEILHFISRSPPLYVTPPCSPPIVTRMPPRGHCTAPIFDPGKPRELKRFFSELNFLFDAANVTDDTEKKNHATRYVHFDIAEIWESLPSFSDASVTYDNFRDAVFELYPAADEEYKYTLADVDFLIAHRLRSDITSLADLADYHVHFLAVTKFLISKQRLPEIEQQRAYPRGFPPALRSKVAQRLQIKFIDHHSDEPYPISDVYAAARFILHTTRSASPSSSFIAHSPAPSSLEPVVNTEQLGTLFSALTKSIIAAIDSTHRHPPAAPSLTNTAPRRLECRFCGEEHFIRNCELVEEYRRAGKLIRNTDGKVVLPTGDFVPRDIPGRFLKECIDEWHRRHPGHLAAPVEHSTTLHSASTPCAASSAPTPSHTRSQAAAEARIADIEAEIARLRSKRPAVTSPITSRLQPFRTAAPTILTLELSPAPRTSHLDPFTAHSSRAELFSSPDPPSTLPHTLAVSEFDHSAPRHPFPVPFVSRAVQNSAPASDNAPIIRLSSARTVSTFSAIRSSPDEVYSDSEHAHTAHSLSGISPRVALASEDQEHFPSSPALSAVRPRVYSTSQGYSGIFPTYRSIPASLFRSDTPSSSIQPFPSFSTAAHSLEPQKYIAPRPESPKIFQTRTDIVSASSSRPDQSLPVAARPDVHKCVSPMLIRSAAPSTNSVPPQGRPAHVDTPNSILAPPHRSYAPPSSIPPHTSPRAALRTVAPR